MADLSIVDSQPLPAGGLSIAKSEPLPRPATSGSIALDFMQGGGAELIGTALGAYNLLRKIPGADKVLPPVSPEVQQYAEPPHTVAAKIGGLFTTLGEFALPAGEAAELTKGAGLLARSAAQGVAAGGVEAARTGGNVPATIDTAALGAAGPVAGAALGAGVRAAGPILAKAPGLAADVVGLASPRAAHLMRIGIRAAKAAGSAVEEAAPAESAAPAAIIKTSGQLFAEANGQDWGRLSAEERGIYEQLAKPRDIAAENAPQPKPLRGSEYYGVKAAEAPPTNPTPSAPPVSAQPASATPSATAPAPTVGQPEFGADGEKFNSQGRPVYNVPTSRLGPKDYVAAGGEFPQTVAKYRQLLREGNVAPPIEGVMIPDGDINMVDGFHRLAAAKAEGRPTVRVYLANEDKLTPAERASLAPEGSAQPSSGAPTAAAAAKSARYADAISKWAKDHGMSPATIANQWESTTPEARGRILLEMKRLGYLGQKETIPNTSAPGIVQALKAKIATIKPPPGFSMGAMKNYPTP